MVRCFALALVTLFAAESFANNSFIPNYYRNRRVLNDYTATAWSDRREVGARYEMLDQDYDTANSKYNKDSKSAEVYGFYRLDSSLSFEGSATKLDSETETVPTPGGKDQTEVMSYRAQAGYLFQSRPLAISAGIETKNEKQTDFNTSEVGTDQDSVSIGVGYQLKDQMFLGFGYKREYTVGSSAAGNIEDYYRLGAGKVIGDKKNPKIAGEAFIDYARTENATGKLETNIDLTAQALMNMDNLQPYGVLTYGYVYGGSTQESYSLKAGADYAFQQFFVGPELRFSHSQGDASERKTKTWIYGAQAGYRKDKIELALEYQKSDAKLIDAKADGDGTDKTDFWTLSGAYFF